MTRYRTWLTVLAVAGIGRFADAQPLPSAPSDSVVKLAYDISRVRGSPLAVLIDESTVAAEPDGTWRREFRQAVQVLDEAALRSVAERAISFAGSHQKLTVRWVRVLRPNGEVVSDRAAQVQDADVPAAVNNPIYQDQRVRRLSLAGVALNTIVDFAYTIEEMRSPREGDFLFGRSLNGPLPVRRSRFVLDLPVGYRAHILERNLVTRRVEETINGRRRLIWTASEQNPVKAEPFASDSNGILQTISVSAAGDWNGLAAWYNGLAQSRYALSVFAAKKADSVIAASFPRTRVDSLRAWHRWVTQDIRYVSVSLGIGGYQPRTPDEVLRTGFGDCKDKATLFIALARRAGIEAEPVILSLSGRPERSLPSVFQFNHAIAAVREGNEWRYTDLTADIFPYGEIPPNYQGSFAVQVTAEGRAREIVLPVSEVAANTAVLSWDAELDASGFMKGIVRETARGMSAPQLRGILAMAVIESRKNDAERMLAQRLLGSGGTLSAKIDSISGTDGRNMALDPRLQYEAEVHGALQEIGGSKVLRIPNAFRGFGERMRSMLGQLGEPGARLMPIDAARILSPSIVRAEWRLTLPQGWTVKAPRDASVTSFFGSYSSKWSLEGRELTLVRELRGAHGVFAPERLAEVRVWLQSVLQDDVEFLEVGSAQR